MLRKIGQSSSIPSSPNAESESHAKKTSVHHSVSHEKATFHSGKDLVAFNGELRRSQLKKAH